MTSIKTKIKYSAAIVLIVYLIYVAIVALVVSLSEPYAFSICLDGGSLNDEENIISYGNAKNGPWITIRDEQEFYDNIIKGGRSTLLTEGDVKAAPKEISNSINLGATVVVRELERGHYLYIFKKQNTVLIWSVTL